MVFFYTVCMAKSIPLQLHYKWSTTWQLYSTSTLYVFTFYFDMYIVYLYFYCDSAWVYVYTRILNIYIWHMYWTIQYALYICLPVYVCVASLESFPFPMYFFIAHFSRSLVHALTLWNLRLLVILRITNGQTSQKFQCNE